MSINKLTRFSLLSLILLFLISCSSTKHLPEVPPEQAVIFIPGFKGSYLKDNDSKETIWINAYQALFGTASLNYQKRKLTPAGIIKKVTIIPGIFTFNIYKTFLEGLEEKIPANTLLINFAYDWREDNYRHVVELANKIRELKKQGINKISLVAHSMGGLIVAYYLRYGDQVPTAAKETWEGAKEINSTVLIATPFKGSLLTFRDLLRGKTTVRNTSLLNAEAMQSFASSYQLLPQLNYSRILDQDLNQQNVDFYREDFWIKNNLLKFTDQKFLKNNLALARNFLDLITQVSPNTISTKSKLLSIKGQGMQTLSQVICPKDLKSSCIFPEDKESKRYPPELFWTNGDGIVNLESATLPRAYQQNLIPSILTRKGEHLEMINDPELIEEVNNFIK